MDDETLGRMKFAVNVDQDMGERFKALCISLGTTPHKELKQHITSVVAQAFQQGIRNPLDVGTRERRKQMSDDAIKRRIRELQQGSKDPTEGPGPSSHRQAPVNHLQAKFKTSLDEECFVRPPEGETKIERDKRIERSERGI